jgi:hypothetical protein
MIENLSILDAEHLIDEQIDRLLKELESTGKAGSDVRLIRNSSDVTLMRLYAAGRKAGLRPIYFIDGNFYAFGGLEREAVKQLVFRYCNEKEAQGGREAQTQYREKYRSIGGNEAYFTKWIVPRPSMRPSPALRSFLKLAVWLDVPVLWGKIPGAAENV